MQPLDTYFHSIVQGDPSRCSLGVVYIKTKVVFQSENHIQKCNIYFDVKKTYKTMWRGTLYTTLLHNLKSAKEFRDFCPSWTLIFLPQNLFAAISLHHIDIENPWLKEIAMSQPTKNATAQVVIPTRSLQDDIPFFTGVLGMRIESIYPADDPSVAVFSGHGMTVRVEKMKDGEDNCPQSPTVPLRILLFCDDPSDFSQCDPEGTKVILLWESEL